MVTFTATKTEFWFGISTAAILSTDPPPCGFARSRNATVPTARAPTARTMPTIFAGGRLRVAVPNSSPIFIAGPGPRSMAGSGMGSGVASGVSFGSGPGAAAGGRGDAFSGMVASLIPILYRLPQAAYLRIARDRCGTQITLPGWYGASYPAGSLVQFARESLYLF